MRETGLHDKNEHKAKHTASNYSSNKADDDTQPTSGAAPILDSE